MRIRAGGHVAVASLAVSVLVATACTGGPTISPGLNAPGSGFTSGQQGLNPGRGVPRRGGTLNMLGTSDVDFLDYNISYDTVGDLAQRMWVRGLYAYPAVPGRATTPEPDLATGPPRVSDGGTTYTVAIRSGARWNTSPFSPVTASDAVLGLKRSCNPVEPFGGLPDFIGLIKGMAAFCTGFAKVAKTVPAIKSYIDTHSIPGVISSGQTITFTLTQPASYFADILALSPFNPAPPQSLNWIPGSAAAQQNTFADGPYKVKSYVPTRKIVFVRNPAWNASTDPISKAYVDQVDVSETGNQTINQQILQTNSAAGSMEWDSGPPSAAVPGLVTQMQHGSTDFSLGPTYASRPFIVFNIDSPNNGGALGKAAVRQAISYAIDRAHLIQDISGPVISPPLTHILPAGINGAQDVPAGYDPYPHDVARAKSMLSAAGYKNGLTLRLLYWSSLTYPVEMFQTLQADLAQAGIKVTGLGVPITDFFTRYIENPSVARRGVWDLALSSWSPDWFGDAATSLFKPLFWGPASYPPDGSDFGFYSNPAVTRLITKAAAEGSTSAAARMWAAADQDVMKDAAIYPISQPYQPLYHASYVHNAVYVPALGQFDPTNLWLTTPAG
jgi:peptide/nickel transport system substrate-binding protein